MDCKILAILGALTITVGCRVELYPSPFDSADAQVEFPSVAAFTQFDVANVKHGAASASIVPPWPVALSGYGGVHRRLLPPDPARIGRGGAWQATHTSVDVAPRIKVFLWQEAAQAAVGNLFILVSVDVVAVSPDFTQALLVRARNVLNRPDLSWHNIAVVASHTHSGPAGISSDALFQAFAGDSLFPKYRDFVLDSFAQSLASARDSAESVVAMSVSEKEIEAVSLDRLPELSRDKRNALFTTSTSEDVGTATVASCLNIFAVHSTFHSQKDRTLSADLAGGIERALETAGKGELCAFLPGAVGNASPNVGPSEGIISFGERFAAVASENPVTESVTSKMEFGGMPVSIPAAQLNFSGCDAAWVSPFVSLPVLSERARATWISWMRFGSVGILMLPGEPLSDVQAEAATILRAAIPELRAVYVVGLANDYQGYFMLESAFKNKSLESCSALYKPAVVREMLHAFSAGIAAAR
jgi:hypothetical protein